MVTDNHYRWDFIGLSTDEKPTPANSEKVVDGSTYYCADTSTLYVYCRDRWYEKSETGGGSSGDANARFQGQDLSAKYSLDELATKVRSGDFSGLSIGDYITKTVKVGSGTARELDFVIGGFDYFYRMGNASNNNHHIVFVADTGFYELSAMDSSGTTANGYYGSKMHGICEVAYSAGSGGSLSSVKGDYESFLVSSLEPNDGTYEFTRSGSQWQLDTTNVGRDLTAYGISYSGTPVDGDKITVTFAKGYLEPYRQAIYEAFGNDKILTYENYITTGSNSAAWHNSRVELMNESMLYGQRIHGVIYSETYSKAILPLFVFEPERSVTLRGKGGARQNCWLSSIANNTSFCIARSTGSAWYNTATGNFCVRPYFLFG